MDTTEVFISFLVELFAGGIGVLVGYKLAVNAERDFRIKESRDMLRQMIESLQGETSSNKTFLEKSKNINEAITVKSQDPLYKLNDQSYKSIIYSGKYHLLKPETQSHISWYYNGISEWNEYGDKL